MEKDKTKEWGPRFWILVFAGIGAALAAAVAGLAIWLVPVDSEMLLDPFPWTVVAAIATVPALILIWYWRKSDKNRDIQNTRERLLHERFESSVKLLGHESPIIRMGGIYSLERLINSKPGETEGWSISDHNCVIEVLAGYVREQTKGKKTEGDEPQPVTEDVQAALTVLGRRVWAGGKGELPISLRGAVLRGTNLSRAKLSRADFTDADLTGADLTGANLTETYFLRAKLKGAVLNKATLTRARFLDTSIFQAHMS